MPRRFGATLAPPIAEPFEINPDSMQARGLVAWYTPLAAPGRLLVPSTGRRAPLIDTTAGAPATANDPVFGRGLSFPASGDTLETSPTFNFSASGNITVAMWLRVTSTANGTARFISINGTGGGGINAWILRRESSSLVYYFWDDVANTLRSLSGGTLAANGLYHIAGTWDLASTTQGLWINGALVNSQVLASNAIDTATTFFRLSQGGGEHASAVIGDTRIYNRALSPAEMWQLYAPQTRWELYRPARWRTIVQGSGAAPPATRRYSLTLMGVG